MSSNIVSVVCTCVSAGALASLGVKPGHFGWIFIDEAGQATEPDTMIPIKELADDYTNVILAGDPETARIMELLKNFRSHPAILAFVNAHFYKNRLQACGDPRLTRSMEIGTTFRRRSFPIIFHAVVGQDQREEESPSYFNINEATIVKNYCSRLVAEKGIRADHIAVITPYHAQRMKILYLFYQDPELEEISVGSVEEFQGQERRIVIISTIFDVLSALLQVHIGSTVRLAFLTPSYFWPLRFTLSVVAVTRAQALLIIVGNADVLALDPIWANIHELRPQHGRLGWKPNLMGSHGQRR
ncbi:P-loop containing nucleoside triphosphate hydrolase protein [Desarmillaria tabescens]|uniref:P-loop containing nucleoside triphosphate hydrolase protein n=1 Tax=Armillaria tabescens TaxID=1929756 RepID=A0AA39JJ06_ARMTA|nr:P-loop containing nucleoside triphosphate hydrolase protein [Desarmillaria tabescens]KAK0442815.1 P-loop containing nucleoside triphosphate hydrolase protein [Desarmillaria tabescens]